MRTKQSGLTAGLALAATFGFAGGAVAAPNPRALGVRINCQLQGMSGSSDTATLGGAPSCKSLSGSFRGRLEWVSHGVVLFEEDGPFVGVPDGGTRDIHLLVDANDDAKMFQRVYESTDPLAPSIL